MSLLRVLAAVVSAGAVSTVLVAGVGSAEPTPGGCPVLWVLGVQGTGQSSPTASATADTGMLGQLLGPVSAAVPHLVRHTYVPYPASFGGAWGTNGGPDPYAESVGDGLAALNATADRIGVDCPSTALAVVGYSQGAHVVSQFARTVGTGGGPVAPDQVAAVALYSDPTRAAGSPVIPGRPGQSTPDPAPGTSGAAVASVAITTAAPAGGGIAAGEGVDYGALTGRVADICVDGDLSCAAPDNAALLRVAAGIAAQADLRDPLAALGSIQALLGGVLGDAWTTVVNTDFAVGPGVVDYAPAASLASRLTDAADPSIAPPSPAETAAANSRWAQITATVTADPVSQLPKLAGQLSDAVGRLLAENTDMTNPAVWLRYANLVAAHTGYAAAGQLATGVAWLTALAHDLAGSQ